MPARTRRHTPVRPGGHADESSAIPNAGVGAGALYFLRHATFLEGISSNTCMKAMLQVCLILLLAAFLRADDIRRVEGNVLISNAMPAVRIQISKEFSYIGCFPFRIQDMAAGYRFIFVDGDRNQVRRMFIVQFESILPESTEIYRYSFDNAILMEGLQFRHNTFAFSIRQDIKENPHAEVAVTQDFLDKKNYKISDEWMASRFLTLGDESRKSEMILFYMEPISSTGYRLAHFYDGDSPTEIWGKISKELDARSRSAFQILPPEG